LIIFISKQPIVSHLHERKEKNCLNCNTQLTGRYCPVCGQENVEPRESLWHLLVHFFNDITHFDGKFFSTIKLLLTRPGFLSEEYMKGRRARYLNPIRMYLFISFLLFFLLFSLPSGKVSRNNVSITDDSGVRTEQKDTVAKAPVAVDTLAEGVYTSNNGEITLDENAWINRTVSEFSTAAQYDSFQHTLQPAIRDNWWEKFLARRLIALRQYVEEHPKSWKEDFLNIFLHSIPKMLFISIPAFAFLLYLLYIRRRRNFYFVSHGIFTIHIYCTLYLLLLITIPFSYIDHPIAFVFCAAVTLAGPILYLFIAMKRFYKQGTFKTFLKFSLLLLFSSIVFFILIILLTINTLMVIGNGAH